MPATPDAASRPQSAKPFPRRFAFDPNVPLRGTLIYLRRTDAAVVLNSDS